MLTEALVHLLASLVVELCVEFAGRSFTVRELWDRVPAPKPQYKSLNGVGDFLGHGKGERSLKLWKGANGPLACRRERHHRGSPSGARRDPEKTGAFA